VLGKTGQDVMRSNGVVPYREAISLAVKKSPEKDTGYPQFAGKF
jgi:hypothetical protein